MATEKPKSFEELVKEAPSAPAAGTVSLVGVLSQSPEHGKFVLTIEDGSAVTLETAAVKGHAVLGGSVGRTVVRVDVDAAKAPTHASGSPRATAAFTNPDIDTPFTVQSFDHSFFWLDHPGTLPYWADNPRTHPPHDYYVAGPGYVAPGTPVQAGGVSPFALATPQQAPANMLAALQGGGGGTPNFVTFGPVDVGTGGTSDFTGWGDQPSVWWDQPHTGLLRDKNPPDDGATNLGSRFLD